MTCLKSLVKEIKNEIRDGIQWIVFYKRGRAWHSYSFYTESGDYDNGYELKPEDIEELKKITLIDHKAICFNGFYMGFGEGLTINETADKILYFYKKRCNELNGDFLGCMVSNY
jgi:hypothetical protein